MIRIEDVQGKWRHRKTGKIVEVVSLRGNSFGLKHASGRETYKAEHYFIEEYERILAIEDTQSRKERCERLDQVVVFFNALDLNANCNHESVTFSFDGYKYEVREIMKEESL